MSEEKELKVEWTEPRLSGKVRSGSEIIEDYRKAMEGKACRVCGEGFPALKSGKLMGYYFDQFLDRHVEWFRREMYDDPNYGYVHTSCHNFVKTPGPNYQFLRADE